MGEELNIDKHKTHTLLYQTDRQTGWGWRPFCTVWK